MQRIADDPYEPRRRRNTTLTSNVADTLGDPARGELLGVTIENVAEIVFLEPVDQVRSRNLQAWIHPHIERAVVLKRKPTRAVVQLRRAYAEVGQKNVHAPKIQFRQRVGQFGEVRVNKLNASLARRQRLLGNRKIRRINVESDQNAFGPQLLSQQRSVTREPDRRIDDNVATAHAEEVAYLSRQHRRVT